MAEIHYDPMQRRSFMGASTREETNWIPCAKRLPKVGEHVICSQINGGVGEGMMYGDGDWHIYQEDSIRKKGWVEAWQPMPEPYEKEGGE